MASTDEDLCTSHADFAVICSFIDKFGEKLGLPLPNIGELQNFLEDTDNVNPLLSQGVCLLLRRINKSVKFDRWERGLQRFAHSYSHQDGWELERFGFKKAKLEVKIRVFKNLLEAQFDLYKSFKDKVNLLGATELRLQPCGRDKKGVSYWCQLDDCANLRIYCDDQDEETWTLVASTREELVALIAELQSESPPGASREMSVDGSRSGTVTPMGLSEAPTPVDSKAPTPVASGRTSPVIDTGQTKDETIKTIKSEVVEKVKERLKVEENEDVPKDGEKLEETASKKKEEYESKIPSKTIEIKEESVKDKKEIPDSDETRSSAERGKDVKEGSNAERGQDVREGSDIERGQDVKEGQNTERVEDVKEEALGVKAAEMKKEENTVLQGTDKKPDEKPLPVNKDTVMRERDKQPESSDKVEVKRKETVWDKLSKQNEEKMEALAAVKEAVQTSAVSDRILEEKLKGKLNIEVVKVPLEGQTESGSRPMEVSVNPVKESVEKKQETKVSEFSVGPSQDKVLHSPELRAKDSSKVEQNVGPVVPPAHKAVVDKPWMSQFPASIGSVSITPVQTSKERVVPPVSESIIRSLPASTTITAATKAGPLSPTNKTGSLSPTSRGGQLSITSKTGPLSPTSKIGPLSPTSKTGPLSPTSKMGPLSPTSKAGPLSPSKHGPLSPTLKLGPLSPTSKVGSVSVMPVPVPRSGGIAPTVKSRPHSPTLISGGKSGPLSPTPLPSSKGGPLSPTPLPSSKGGPPSPSSLTVGKSGSHSSVEVKSNKDGPLPPQASVISARPVSPSTVLAEKEPSSVQNLPSVKEIEKVSSSSHTVPAPKSQASTVSAASAVTVKSVPSADSDVSSAVSSHLVQHSKIPPPSSSVSVTSTITSPASIEKSAGFSSNESSAKTQQNKVQVQGDSQKSVSVDKSETLAPEGIIPPFPSVPTKNTHPSTPKDVPTTSSVLSLKSVPRVALSRPAESIPSLNMRAPPLENVAPCLPNEAQLETPILPFLPSPGVFPPVRKLTSSDVPSAPVVKVSKDKLIKYFKPPSLLSSSSTYIPSPPSKAPPFEQMAPALPAESAVLSEPFPKVPTAFPAARASNKDTPSSNGAPKTQIASSTYFGSPPKFTSSPVIPTPLTRAPSFVSDAPTQAPSLESDAPTRAPSLESDAPTRAPSLESDAPTRAPSLVSDAPTWAPSLVSDANITEPPQKKAKVEGVTFESQKESPKVPLGGSGRVLNLLKRSHVPNPDEKKEVGGPQEAKVMKTEEPNKGSVTDDVKLKKESSLGKTPMLSKNVFTSKEENPPKSGTGIQPGADAAQSHTTEAKSGTEVKKPSSDPPRRLLKLHNFSREPVKPVLTQPVEKKAETSSKDELKKPDSETTKDSDVGEAIEEPVMIVKGEGEGAKCESGNDLYYLEGCHSSRPWWECFDNDSSSHNVADNEDNCETIEESVMYFWGDGNGKDCDAGNNGDETETNAETKQESSGNSTLVASDNRSNSTSGDIKSQKEKEAGRTDNDLKEVDGIADSDEAKVNGLRTLESEKNIDQLGKTESKGDGKLSGVNGKKSNEDNDIYGEKSITNKSSKVGDGKNKKDKSRENDNCESVVSKDVSNKGETVIQRQDSSKTKGESESTVGLSQTDNSEKGYQETGREACAKRGTRNRASLEEVKDESEDSEMEEFGSAVEETPTKKKRGRPKGTTIAARGRKSKPPRVAPQPVSELEDEDLEEGDEDSQENISKRKQRGKGSTARPLPDAPRQRSARIAKIREKEEEERRQLEALRMKQLAEENRLKELKRKAREERRAQREIKKGKREKKEKKDKEKKKKKKKRAKKKTGTGDPWENSSSSSSSSSEEDDIEEEEEDENLEFKSDHEFSPESDIEDADAQPIRRARTAKKVDGKSDIEEEEEEEEVEEEEEDQTQCTKCGHDDHPETILLCDSCDAGWHLSCLRPPLLSVPEGDWICPTCEHVMLIKKLKEVLERFDECQKKAHNEELRRQRLAYVNVSLDNILPEGGKKKKKRRREDGEEEDDDESGSDSDSDDSDSESDDDSSGSSDSSSESDAPLYTLRARSSRTLKEQVEDFDEMINEAIRDEMEAAAGAGNAGRGKDIDNIIQANNEEPEEVEPKEECKDEVENKENEKPVAEVTQTEESKAEEKEEKEEKEENEEVKREREADDEEDEVAPKRKKQKPSEKGSENDEDYKESDEHHESESEDEEEVKPVRKRSKPYNMFFKKRRRLTDLDAEDDDDASDEDFMNSSEEEEEESEESAVSSSSLATEYDSDDSDVVGGKRRRSRYDSLPLRRSTRNRQSAPYEEDSDDERGSKRSKKKKKRRRSSSEEEESSESDTSYKRKKKVNQRKKQVGKVKGRRGSKKGRGKKQTKSKARSKKSGGGEEGEKPVKPRIKYSKPPKSGDQGDEVVTQKRVTRGRQVSYYDALLMSDESEDEEPKKKWRGKVMKGERVPTESSEYEASEDERKKRCGVSGGLGRGKVMKGEEEDEEDDRPGSGKKKRGRPKKDDELIGKPSPPRPSTIRQTPVMQVSSVSTPTPPPTVTQTPAPAPAPAQAQFLQTTAVTPPPPTIKPAVAVLPLPVRVKPTDAPATPASVLPVTLPPAKVPVTMQLAAAYVPAGASPVHRTPEPAASPSPGASVPPAKVIPAGVVVASNLGGNSPGHQPQQPIGKWSPHLPGVTITNVPVSSAPGTPPRPNMGSAPGSGTPPRPTLSGPSVTASPPPPYRSSPLPMTSIGRGATPSNAPSVMPPVGPPNTSSPHSAAYPPYRPPPDHYSPHPGKERFPSHPAFPEYAAPGRHSPSSHGVPPRHPSHLPSGHSLPHMPAGYGPPGQGSYPPGGVPPPHPGVLRGPPHDLYRPPHSSHPSHGSPSHPGHPHLVMKPGYPGLEPLPYAGSPGPSPGSIGIHQGSQDSPAQQSPNEDSKDGSLPASKGPGEFSSGLMSYFSSQRDDDVE